MLLFQNHKFTHIGTSFGPWLCIVAFTLVCRGLTLYPVSSSARDMLQPKTGVVGCVDNAMLSSLLNKSLSLRRIVEGLDNLMMIKMSTHLPPSHTLFS